MNDILKTQPEEDIPFALATAAKNQNNFFIAKNLKHHSSFKHIQCVINAYINLKTDENHHYLDSDVNRLNLLAHIHSATLREKVACILFTLCRDSSTKIDKINLLQQATDAHLAMRKYQIPFNAVFAWLIDHEQFFSVRSRLLGMRIKHAPSAKDIIQLTPREIREAQIKVIYIDKQQPYLLHLITDFIDDHASQLTHENLEDINNLIDEITDSATIYELLETLKLEIIRLAGEHDALNIKLFNIIDIYKCSLLEYLAIMNRSFVRNIFKPFNQINKPNFQSMRSGPSKPIFTIKKP